MSAAEEYARQARLAAEESKASAERSAAHAQASAEATASMIIGSASSAATSAEASATAAATAASQAIAARDLAEASGERARQAADGAERSQADVAHSVELIRGMTIGLKLPACTNKGIMPSEEGVYVSWKDPEDLMLGDSPVAEWARTELWRLEIPNDADIAYPTWPLGDDGAVLVAVSTPEGGRDAFLRTAFLDTGARADRRYGYRLVSYTTYGGATMRDEDRLPISMSLSWPILGALSRSGALSRMFPVGSTISLTHTEFPDNDMVRVVGFDGVTPVDSTIKHTTQLQVATCLYRSGYLTAAQFDAQEPAYAITLDILAVTGKVYYVKYLPLTEGTDWNAGDDLTSKSWYELQADGTYRRTEDATAVSGKVYYKTGSTYRALVEDTDWTAGDPVPTATWYERNPNGDASYGNNDIIGSSLVRWLDSDAPRGQWYTPSSLWDTTAAGLKAAAGFRRGLPEDLKSQLVECWRTAHVSKPNAGGATGVVKRFKARVYLPTRYEVFGAFDSDYGPDGLLQWEWYKTQANRIMTAGGSVVNWWLASPNVGSGDRVCSVTSSGVSSWYRVDHSFGVAPALSI